MPVSKDEFPEREFWGRAVSFSASDCETLYWLVEESQIEPELKERLTNKLRGYYVSPKTQKMAQKLLKSRAKAARQRRFA